MRFWRRTSEILGFSRVPNRDPELLEKGWWHSFEFPSGERVDGVRSTQELNRQLARFHVPNDISGKRVLDIGAWDGWFSFEMERRGADVLAVDSWDNPRFRYAHTQFNSRVHYCVEDLYDLTPRKIGHFDIVLFFGGLYHLKHPVLALEKVCALTRDVAYVESHVIDRGLRSALRATRAVMEFYETNELAGRADNWIGPNSRCLLALCRVAGFARARLESVAEHRAYVTCYRAWDCPEGGYSGSAPTLIKAIHNRDRGINFCSSRDEYISCWFRTAQRNLRREDVRPIVGAWGATPLSLEPRGGDVWQANFKLPPGLDSGFHDVKVGISQGAFSNACRIAVDVAPVTDSLVVTGLCDGRTWKPDEVRLQPDGIIAVWVAGLPYNADLNNTEVILGGRRLAVEHVAAPEAGQPTQVNARVPADFPVGQHSVQVRVANTVSAPIDLMVVVR